jgi:hypothetical protein
MLRDLAEVIVMVLTGTLAFIGVLEIFNAFIKRRSKRKAQQNKIKNNKNNPKQHLDMCRYIM